MSFIRYMSFYNKFSCIADKCSDNCCIGWEIDIDEDTLEKYMLISGELGDKLKKNIYIPNDGENESPHFITKEGDRCPFLDDKNLCEIISQTGEDNLCQICDDHPRFYDWFVQGKEAGLGLCCEEAARLLLTEKISVLDDIYSEETVEEPEMELDQEDQFMLRLEQILFEIREKVFEQILQAESIETAQRAIYENIDSYEKDYSALLNDYFLNEEVEETFGNLFWNTEKLENIIDFYKTLEINNPEWLEILESLKKDSVNVIEQKNNFTKYYKENMYQYKNLLIYFIYRYFMKVRFDDQIGEKIRFAILNVNMIMALGIHQYVQTGKLDITDQVNICKMYSKEIEYDEENVYKLEEL